MKRAIAIGIATSIILLSAVALMPAITVKAQPMLYSTTVIGVVKDIYSNVYDNSPPNSITITTSEGTWLTQTNATGVYRVENVIYTDDEDPEGGGVIDPKTGEIVDIYVDFYANEPHRWGEITGHNNTKNAIPDGETVIDIITDQPIPEFSNALIPIITLIAIFSIIAIRRRK